MANATVYRVKLEKLRKQREGINSAIRYYEGKLEETYAKQRLQSIKNR